MTTVKTMGKPYLRERLGTFSGGMKTASAMTVVHLPFFPTADWVIFSVLTIFPPILKTCSRSFQATFGSNSTPKVVASICAARSQYTLRSPRLSHHGHGVLIDSRMCQGRWVSQTDRRRDQLVSFIGFGTGHDAKRDFSRFQQFLPALPRDDFTMGREDGATR